MAKGAIELSMNMLVVIIISLVILGGGVAFLYKLIAGAESLKTDLDKRTQDELERLLVEQGQQVALPFRQATIERGEQHVFGLGILNIGADQEFRIQVALRSAKDKNNEEIGVAPEQIQPWLLYTKEPFPLTENEHHREGILMEIPRTAVPGEYLFGVEVLTADGERYGNVQIIVVEVK